MHNELNEPLDASLLRENHLGSLNMSAPCLTRVFVIASLALPMTVEQPAEAGVSIRLKGFPERLSFPIRPATNLILTAEISGGDVRSVWLSPCGVSGEPKRLTLTQVGENEFQINLATRQVYDLLKEQIGEGELRVLAETKDGTLVQSIAVRYVLHALPKRLEFPWDEARLTICQRCSKELPGSMGALRLRIGDITAGQVLVSVYGPDEEPLVPTTSMQEGDTAPLRLAEQEYVLHLERLVNLLIGEDYAVFAVLQPHAWEAQRIEHLLDIIDSADVRFIRHGQELSGSMFADFLRLKYEQMGPREASLDQFIEEVASRSSSTGQPYQVKLSDGELLDAGAWLRQQAKDRPLRPSKQPSGHQPPPDPSVAVERD
jgi:hypothetical protein